ncbi:MAG: Dabb family protein [Acidimicrobiia bacterium]
MIRHVVVFRFAEGVDAAAASAAIGERLGRLPALIPQLRRYAFGPDLGLVEGNGDYAVVADVADADDWAAYLDHPEHRAAVAEAIRPVVAERVAVQVALPDDRP